MLQHLCNVARHDLVHLRGRMPRNQAAESRAEVRRCAVCGAVITQPQERFVRRAWHKT